MRIVSPSLLSKPSDMIKILIPGNKFVRGRGRAIEIAKIKDRKPIILVPRWEDTNVSLGWRSFSIFFRMGEDFTVIKARVERFNDFFISHFGSHGESYPQIICHDRKSKGTLKIVVKPGIYGMGIETGNANITIKIPKPLSCSDIFSSPIVNLSVFERCTTLCKKSEVDIFCFLLIERYKNYDDEVVNLLSKV
jgi:hypothetical protein